MGIPRRAGKAILALVAKRQLKSAIDGTVADQSAGLKWSRSLTESRVVATNQRRPGGPEIAVTRERFRSGDQLNQVCSRFTVHRRARTLEVDRVLTPRRGHTDQAPPSFCR